jgi:transcriptional regulator with AAA-type ATPase domain
MPSPTTATTCDDPTVEPARGHDELGLRVAVLWHPDPARIGATAWAPWGPGATLDLGRIEPIFDDGAGLDDPRISRSPLQLVQTPRGAELWPTREGLRFDVHGRPGRAGLELSAAALGSGVRLGLGRGALLDVRLGPPPLRRPIPELVGRSEALDALAVAVARAAEADGHVFVHGESGTGKELVARSLHRLSPRAARPFVAVNTAALTSTLGPAQLFGHTRGAFTGADTPSAGFFGQANHGTLFLDEIGACPEEVQAQLLRALDSGEVQVVGGSVRTVDVRVVAATDADLAAACLAGRFRAPLYHRLARWTLRIPPLRARPVDVAVQARHFLAAGLAHRRRAWPTSDQGASPWLGRAFVEALLDWPWPGNTRELRALIERTLDRDLDAATCGPPPFEPLTSPTPAAAPPKPAEPALSVEEALARCDYRLSAAAELLGVSRNTLKRRMEALALRRPADLAADEIRAVLDQQRELRAAARALRVSEHGLRLRMTELGLGERAR